MSAPLPVDVLAFLGTDADSAGAAEVEQIRAHLNVVTQMVKTYVRGVGFDVAGDPDDALAAVIVTSTVRLMNNPTLDTFTAVDDAQIRQGTFQGWTLPELAILHAYRARAR